MSDLENEIEALIAKRKIISQKNKENFSAPDNYFEIEKDFNSEVYVEIKKKIIEHLRAAKMSHKKWMSFVQILIRLEDIQAANATISINYTLCDFGKWYYGEGQVLSFLSEYIQMEEIHKNVHDTYLQIYELYVKPISGSFFKSEKSQKQMRNKKALALYEVLDEYSNLMYDLLVFVENTVKEMTKEKILSLEY